jgi:hypothetical protein
MYELVLVAIGYLIGVIFCWKTFYWFQTSWVDHATTTGFSMFVSRVSFAIFVPGLIAFFLLALLVPDNKYQATSQEVNTNNKYEPKTIYQEPIKNDNLNPSIPQEQVRNDNLNQSTPQEQVKNDNLNQSTPQEPIKTENQNSYDGDDPIVRARLGLPPK